MPSGPHEAISLSGRGPYSFTYRNKLFREAGVLEEVECFLEAQSSWYPRQLCVRRKGPFPIFASLFALQGAARGKAAVSGANDEQRTGDPQQLNSQQLFSR